MFSILYKSLNFKPRVTIWLNKVGRANFSAKMLKMWKQFFRLLIFIGISGGHDMHDGLRERKFKFEDSWTVKLLRHLVGIVFVLVLLILAFSR